MIQQFRKGSRYNVPADIKIFPFLYVYASAGLLFGCCWEVKQWGGVSKTSIRRFDGFETGSDLKQDLV